MIKSRLYEKQIGLSSIQVKKTEINFEKLLDWTGFKLAPNDYNACVMTTELAGEFNPETKKYFK